MQVIEHAEGRCETQKIDFGTGYRCYPECIVIECDCGERSIVTRRRRRDNCSSAFRF